MPPEWHSELLIGSVVVNTIGIVVTDPGFFTPEDPDNDTAPLVAALAARGVEADPVQWRDSSVDWGSYDLLVIRSPWDYVHRVAEFAGWLAMIEESDTRLLNDPRLILWNMDKQYLRGLADAGVPVIPTTYHDTQESVAEALAGMGGAPVVIKPTVGAGAAHTGLFAASDPAARNLARETLGVGGTVMLQPEVPELSDGREKAVYLVDGHVTHAIAKGPLLERGGGYLGGVYQGHPEVVGFTAEEQAFAEHVIALVGDVSGTPMPLYGRIDMVDSAEHGRVLLEAELFEPAFHFHIVPEVAEVLADAILSRLARV